MKCKQYKYMWLGYIFMSVYNRFFGSSIAQILMDVFNSLVYAYTTVEYKLEQFTKTCSYYKTNYADPIFTLLFDVKKIDNTHLIKYVKDNVEYTSETVNEDNFDFVLLETEDKIFIDQNIESINDRSSSKTSPAISFITFDVTFEDKDDKHEEITETLGLTSITKSDKYIQLGNKIDKYVIWYLVKKQFGVCRLGKSYTLQIIDNNVNMFTLFTADTITIMEGSIKTS